MTDIPHTAIASCSGYIYQGKIAVMHCLRLFEELGSEAKDLYLEIESLDDFAILDQDGNYISMHQVKAKKSNLFSQYKSAVEKQISDSNGLDGIDVYFHVATLITDVPEDFSESYNPVKFYLYKGESGNESSKCSLDEVDMMNEVQVKRAYMALEQESYKYNDQKYLEKTRQYLEDLVVKHIIEVHHKIILERKEGRSDRRIAMESKISLENFYNLLVYGDLNNIDDGEDYFHFHLLKDAGSYFHEYCLSEIEGETKALLKMNSYLSKINKYEIPELTQFIRTILPHKEAAFKTLSQFKDNTFDREDFQYGLLPILHELKDSESSSELLFYWAEGDKNYIPTAITRNEKYTERLCVEIVKAALEHDVGLLYENGNLINQDIDCDSILSNVNMGRLSFHDDPNGLADMRINSFSNVALISINSAKELINE